MTDSEQKGTRRGRAAAQAEPSESETPPEGEAATQPDAPPDAPPEGEPEGPPEPQEGELPMTRLMTDEADTLVNAPAHEVAGALALAGIDSPNVSVDEVESALSAYRGYVPEDSTHHPEDQEA